MDQNQNARFGDGGDGSDPDRFTADYEVWNRRKYPIQVRNAHVIVHSYDLHFDRKSPPYGETEFDVIEGGRASSSLNRTRIEPFIRKLPFPAPGRAKLS